MTDDRKTSWYTGPSPAGEDLLVSRLKMNAMLRIYRKPEVCLPSIMAFTSTVATFALEHEEYRPG